MTYLPLQIAVDAMGGDYAPQEVVKGALEYVLGAGAAAAAAAEDERVGSDGGGGGGAAQVLLVGDPERIGAVLESCGTLPFPHDAVRVVPASQVIAMDEHPAEAVREKRDASLVVCAQLVRSGKAQATFSAGNTGAVMVAAISLMEKIEGIKRPAIATLMPTETGGRAIVVDAGANIDCRPSHLLQFGLMGAVYADRVLGIARPRVGLLANGEEETKGNELSREAFRLLSSAPLHFVGNVEGNHVFEGGVDVVVCDGFVGNVLLKGAEGTVRLVLSLLAADARRAADETVREALLHSLLRLRQQVDYAEFGGAPLLGVDGVSFIAHGRSDSKAIANGIRMAVAAARSGYVDAVRSALQEGAT